MKDVGPSVPSHLRRFVVEQDYSRYTAVDQAVWRFVLLQTRARLMRTAHPAYKEGLAATGISVDRIPRIEEMNEKLSRFGWGAVCVDGFIPPRAFQEFQACGILPIAGEVRTREHLVYTPAPDIIHEAAGHAPILPDPVYAAYVRRIGDLGRQAFTLPEEDRVYRAIYALSEAMENSGGRGDLARIEAELGEALGGASEASEAAQLSRLYWWTAEYGLVGRIEDYTIYGAGLLSSLGESHSCHAPTVTKLPLDEECLNVPYDITRPQPQLFVVPSFDALHATLDRAASALAARRGGAIALARAIRSRDVASVHFSSGACAIGVLAQCGPGLSSPAWLAFDGPGAFAWDGSMSSAAPPLRWDAGFCVVVGRLASGMAVERLDEESLRHLQDPSTRRATFEFASGARVQGHVERTARHPDGRLLHAELSDVRLLLPDLPARCAARYTLVAAGDVLSAHAGSVDAAYHPGAESAPGGGAVDVVPRSRARSAQERRLIALYERSYRAHRAGGVGIDAEFRGVIDELDRDYPEEWLLRWNLLESVLNVRADGKTARGLRGVLERLEVVLGHRQPIAAGLRYLTGLVA